jgi:hypothetical protein
MYIHEIEELTNHVTRTEVADPDFTESEITQVLKWYAEEDELDLYFYISSTVEVVDGELKAYRYDPLISDIYRLDGITEGFITRAEINAFRDQLDESPVTMDGHSFDADQLSLRKMTDVANFVSNEQDVIWTLADNTSYTFTGSAFKTIVDRVKKGQTKRSYYLHSHAKALKTKLPDVFDSALNSDLWPMDTTI